MAFGFKSDPTRKYSYAVPKGGVFENGEAAVNQLLLAHRLRNKLVEVELARRDGANRIVHEAAPELAAALAAAEALAAEVEALRAELGRRNSAAGIKNADRTLAAHVRDRAKALREAWAAHKGLRTAAFADPAVRDALARNDAAALAAKDAARKDAVGAGLYWATSLQTMTRVKTAGPRPRFARWSGEGTASVQFQRKGVRGAERAAVLKADGSPRLGRKGKPMTRAAAAEPFRAAELFAGNTLARVERRTLPDGSAHRKRCVVTLRVGSDAGGNGIYARVEIVYHRPLPPDGEIKWIHLVRRRTGTHYRWEVQFDVARPHWEPSTPRAESGVVAVALGWRKRPDGSLRVASWVGDDGDRGEVVIPTRQMDAWRQCDDLRAIRDTNSNAARDRLARWLGDRELPLRWRARTATLGQWRSAGRLAALVVWWRDHRLEGDDEVYAAAEGETVVEGGKARYTGGRRQDRHLCDWAEFQRLRLRRWRRHYYRTLACDLARRYRDVVTAEIDWHALGETEPVESEREDVNKTNRGRAAVAELKGELENRMRPVEVSAVNVAAACHRCGQVGEAVGRGNTVRCEHCGGVETDRAENAARNLLARGLEQEPAAAATRGE
jgi:hypothetical protein